MWLGMAMALAFTFVVYSGKVHLAAPGVAGAVGEVFRGGLAGVDAELH
eukprot:gene12751-biopygen7883